MLSKEITPDTGAVTSVGFEEPHPADHGATATMIATARHIIRVRRQVGREHRGVVN